MGRSGATALVAVVTAAGLGTAGCGLQPSHSRGPQSGASAFASVQLPLPQGRKAAAWDGMRGRLWVLTAEDITRQVSLTSYDPSTQKSVTSVISTDDNDYINGAVTVDASYVWAAWGQQLVRFDPSNGSTSSFDLPQPLTGDMPTEIHIGDSRMILSMAETTAGFG